MNILEGQNYIKNKEFGKALAFFLKLQKIDLNNVIIFFYLGLIHFELNKFKESIFYYNKFLKKKPQSEAGLLNLAIAKQSIGQSDSAKELYRKIININKLNVRAYYGLYMLDSKFLKDDLFTNLYEISNGEKLNFYQKGIIDFLFSKKAKIENDKKKEIKYLENSHKKIFNSNKSYNLSAQFYYNNVISKFFDKLVILDKEKIDNKIYNKKVGPIFIIGLPRSGSTLIESILTSSVENLVSYGECHVFNMSILDQLSSKIFFGKFNDQDFEFIINYKKLRKSVLEKYSQFSNLGNIKFIDKSLENIFNIELIKNIFPEAKFINTYRNPLDSVISIYQSMLPDLSWTHSIKDILVYIDNHYKVLKYFKLKYPDIIMDISLEEFTEKSEKLTRQMFNFCHLTWSENTLSFYKRKNLFSKTLSFTQIRSKVSKYNKNKYQPYYSLLNQYKSKYSWLNLN